MRWLSTRLTIDTGLDVFFCDPHSSWQRVTSENTNGGCCVSTFPRAPTWPRDDGDELDAVARTLNTRPRKTLEWATPAEALDRLLSSCQSHGVASTP